ncbi:MAG: hypothetical protein ACON4W_08500 [Parvibaculales bacterium]
MFQNLPEKLLKLAGLLLLALGLGVFQYYFVPITVSKDSRGFYVNPTSFLHGSEKIESLADEFCGQKGQRVNRFRSGSKSMGGKYQSVYRFDCVAR